jgi:multidrug resistance efflux pump
MNEEINIRSDEVREIMEKIPGWLTRWGTTLIFFIIAIILVGSNYFKYPTIIPSEIVVTTENPPASLVARANGRLSNIFVTDTQKVTLGQTIAIIENPANYQDVNLLKDKLKYVDGFITHYQPSVVHLFSNNLELGELQNAYTTLVKQLFDYKNFIELDYHNQKTLSLQTELRHYNSYSSKLGTQAKILGDKVNLSKRQFKRDSVLFVSGVISNAEFEKSRSSLLDEQYNLEQVQLNLSSSYIQVAGLKKQILELQLEKNETQERMKTMLQESLDNLRGELSKWDLRYILKAPTDGIITFTKIWSQNQIVREGEVVFTVIPENPGEIIGKINLPIKGSGKVKTGHEVNIKFDNYPYLEYGLVKGEVKNISLVPEGDYYFVEVKLVKGLVTFYGKELQFNQEMQGNAEIITEKLSLLRRIINPIKYLIEKNLG